MVLNLSAFETRGKKTSKLNLSAFGIKKKEAMSPSFKLNAPAPSLGLGGVSTPATLAPGSEPLGALVKGVGQGFARGTAATGARLASQVKFTCLFPSGFKSRKVEHHIIYLPVINFGRTPF